MPDTKDLEKRWHKEDRRRRNSEIATKPEPRRAGQPGRSRHSTRSRHLDSPARSTPLSYSGQHDDRFQDQGAHHRHDDVDPYRDNHTGNAPMQDQWYYDYQDMQRREKEAIARADNAVHRAEKLEERLDDQMSMLRQSQKENAKLLKQLSELRQQQQQQPQPPAQAPAPLLGNNALNGLLELARTPGIAQVLTALGNIPNVQAQGTPASASNMQAQGTPASASTQQNNAGNDTNQGTQGNQGGNSAGQSS